MAMSPRVPWVQLSRRIYQIDLLSCTGRGGEVRHSDAVTEPAAATEMLARLGPPLEAPECRARDPTDGDDLVRWAQVCRVRHRA
ncbi:uncharacterized protein SOCE836_064850 [Sorangium cellulosum]|uniref:Uncharacterized protein n=1 Tax=Sorangium cellulosum TaxID=56 RepID=A0A4P2QXP6_SORCE|nr:uncharacterized protein SOCE836_064850 [Sorangium cellulosum]